MRTATVLTRVGLGSDPQTGAISTPIYLSATFQHPALGQSTGFDYSRTANPTRQVLEEALATLEGGTAGFAFSTGMAAITTLLLMFRPGDHLIVTEDLYGGTFRILDKVMAEFGLEVSYIDTSRADLVEKAFRTNTKAVLVESPTNPLLKVANLSGLAQISRNAGALLIVDNTFLTPYFQQPLKLGADIVIHSATKYLGGHNDLLAGVVVVNNEALKEKVAFLQNSTGNVLGAFDSWLLLRGLKTLALRVEKQAANALALSQWLVKHPKVANVYYPGLDEHPGHELIKKQASGYGGMVAFNVQDPALVEQVLERVKILSFAESLGGVESLITYPAVQTHADIPQEVRAKLGINDTLLRVSLGIEDPRDLIEDLEQALR